MNIIKTSVRFVLACALGCGCLMAPGAIGADASPSVPHIIQAVNDPAVPFNVWKKGGLMENDSKVTVLANYFRQIERVVGGYKSYELVEAKRIGQNSRIIYLATNFERGAVYARFLVYRADNNWVVQNMDFSTRPEAIMPWLAFEGGDYGG